ncbi:MAG: NACHT domain-containing NTPase [Desmonostoc vinosum HA7617-LM4]|jgi:predicted NACHT family NTPase|nr:NACHT domain-containing NTPase [Desmonostoc vinosum HA7617-LM4]
MTSQGLRASPEGIKAAKTALTDKTWSQYKLAAALGITRQPVAKFFAGESVSRTCFVQICQQLGLSWQQVAGLSEDATSKLQSSSLDLDALVREVRQKRQDKIQDQCSTVQMLDVGQTVQLLDIYTNINFWEEITSQQWREISDLLKNFQSESDWNRLGHCKHQRRLSGLEVVSQYSKLMILGKPGSGKTIFLQYLAIACNKGEFQPHRITIFIKLKEFAEDAKEACDFNLLNYITQELISCGVKQESTITLLTQGKLLILLDGLDEVPALEAEQVTISIRRLAQIFYKNQFIISSRIAAQKYRFAGFTEFEIADFNARQVEVFVKNWFVAVTLKSREEAESRGNLFINQLNLPENQHIRELAETPILLHLICLVFYVKNELPANLTKLYEQAVNILLFRWDDTKGIKRDRIFNKLNSSNKKKLLSKIAAITFEQGDYFFETGKIQCLITEYFDSLQIHSYPVDSINILKEIEVQNGLFVERAKGIYSFSHLTFQEYFTAQNIVESFSIQAANNFLDYINNQRWRQIFLLTVSMLTDADTMLHLIKYKIDLLLADDDKLQYFLTWLNQKSSSISTTYKPVAIRAFYLVCDRAFTRSPIYDLECAIVGSIAFDYNLALDEFLLSTVACVNELESAFEHTHNNALAFDHAHALIIAFEEALELVIEPRFKQALQQLKKQLPHIDSNQSGFRNWWQAQGQAWGEQLRNILIEHRNIGYNWQFDKQQKELLQQYYDANKLLVDCLNRAANITPLVRQAIEETLLLAIADIKSVISCTSK